MTESIFPSHNAFIHIDNEQSTHNVYQTSDYWDKYTTQQYKFIKTTVDTGVKQKKLKQIIKPSTPDRPKIPSSRETFHEEIDWTGRAQRIRLKKMKKQQEFKHIVVGSIIVDITDLFLGELQIESEMIDTVEGMGSCRIKVFVNEHLLSEEQKRILNPLCLTIVDAHGMPNKPISYKDLDCACMPVYTQFRFGDDSHIYISKTDSFHKSVIPFHTRHLILPGLLDEDELRDKLLNSKLEIQDTFSKVHDRDYKFPIQMGEYFSGRHFLDSFTI
ncbi:hypothetical protein HK096_007390 [Nowakowskiella sp. JEL0078]|nr:hypothetical protein HK096_007390 [Nowakowskiella sp. JEL0078]